MPSRESVSETIRARTEFITAVRTGIDALMGRCGYSRERATLVLLKELNRGENGPDSKPTDNEIFDAMRRHKVGLDEANRAIVVSRAMRRELLSRSGDDRNITTQKVTSLEAIHRLTLKLSLDNILYESGEDDSDDDGQNEIQLPTFKIPKVSRVPSSTSVNISSSSSTTSSNTTNHSTTSNTNNSRKNARGKSPRKRTKANNNNNNNNNNSNTNSGNSILVGRKRSIEDMDNNSTTKQNSDIEKTKAATGRPQLRASKRLHRSSASTEASVVSSGLNANK